MCTSACVCVGDLVLSWWSPEMSLNHESFEVTILSVLLMGEAGWEGVGHRDAYLKDVSCP